MELNENSLLATLNPFSLLAGIFAMCLLAWFCARRYRNTNDFKKSVQLYLPLMTGLDLALLFGLDIGIFLCLGIDLFGFIALALISNHYFYH